tara:strand:- start:1400 stop:1978 length:579 start_codon:yes stop_codon:yes gene_type:complete
MCKKALKRLFTLNVKQNYMKHFKFLILFNLTLIITACQPNEVTKSTPQNNLETEVPPVINKSQSRYPLKIGNDSYFINILKTETIDKGSISTNFNLILKGKTQRDYNLEKEVNIDALLDSCRSFLYKDTINKDFLNQTYIDSILYYGIRSNTLHFKINHINKSSGDTVKGEFLLFYRSKRKGEIYHWGNVSN